MKRKFSVMLSIMLLVCLFGSSALAVGYSQDDSGLSVERFVSCGNCGGGVYPVYKNVKTSKVIGTCEDNPKNKHYRAYRYKRWTCQDCGEVEFEEVIETGHYCNCSCHTGGCWCWD